VGALEIAKGITLACHHATRYIYKQAHAAAATADPAAAAYVATLNNLVAATRLI
jgi:hypothetical protein